MIDARRNLSTKISRQNNIGRRGVGISSVKFDHRLSGYILSMIVDKINNAKEQYGGFFHVAACILLLITCSIDDLLKIFS